jgi:hypothetical protein
VRNLLFADAISNPRAAAMRNLLSRPHEMLPHIKALMITFAFVALLASCSPREVLSRRLAADLIVQSATFEAPQQFVVQTGVVSNKNYLSPESVVLQHRGWIAATTARCPADLIPGPCWDIVLTPSGVDAVRNLVSTDETSRPAFAIPAARRELVEITGVTKQGSAADVEFTWKWIPLNEIGAALYSSDLRYKSTVGFRNYDDGWRVSASPVRSGQTLDDALKNAEPAQ